MAANLKPALDTNQRRAGVLAAAGTCRSKVIIEEGPEWS